MIWDARRQAGSLDVTVSALTGDPAAVEVRRLKPVKHAYVGDEEILSVRSASLEMHYPVEQFGRARARIISQK